MGQSQGRESKEAGRTLSVPNPNLDPSVLAQIVPSEPSQDINLEGNPEQYKLSEKQLNAFKREIEIQVRQNINEQLKERMKEGLTRSVEETERKFLKYTGPRSPFANEQQQKVHQCYHENLRHPLNCSKIVREFTETVERERQNAAFSRQS